MIETDFSEYNTDKMLSQYDDKEFLHLCVYFLKWNASAECNYEIYDKKLLTII